MPAVLALDTATPAVVAALVSLLPQPEVLAARVAVDARRHGELLAPAVRDLLADAGRRPAELTAAVLADALGIPAYGVCSLDAVAVPARGRRLLVATDARRREVYWACYDDGGARVAGPEVLRPADLAPRLGPLGVTAMCGAGARQYADTLRLPLLDADYPDPAALARLAADRVLAGAPSEPLTPLYLRRPDAAPPGRAKPVTAGAR